MMRFNDAGNSFRKLWLAKHPFVVLISSQCVHADVLQQQPWPPISTSDLLNRGGCQFRSGWIAIALLKLVRHSSA